MEGDLHDFPQKVNDGSIQNNETATKESRTWLQNGHPYGRPQFIDEVLIFENGMTETTRMEGTLCLLRIQFILVLSFPFPPCLNLDESWCEIQ